MKPQNLLDVLVDLWAPQLGLTEFKILAYLYRIATPDGKIGKSIHEISEATNLAWRTVQAKLQDLDTLGVIEVISSERERTLIRIPTEHWSLPFSDVKSVDTIIEQPATISELILRLTGQRPTPDAVAKMITAAGNDELRLQFCLDSFRVERKGWTSVELLTVAVHHELRTRDYFDDTWSRR